jgi:hypothetical protein
MKKADLEKLVEELAHVANGLRSELLDHLAHDETPQSENDFWGAIQKLPEEMRSSVIN